MIFIFHFVFFSNLIDKGYLMISIAILLMSKLVSKLLLECDLYFWNQKNHQRLVFSFSVNKILFFPIYFVGLNYSLKFFYIEKITINLGKLWNTMKQIDHNLFRENLQFHSQRTFQVFPKIQIILFPWGNI